MKRSKAKKLTLTRETVQAMSTVVAGVPLRCSVQVCPPDQASEGLCSNTCTCSCA